MSDNFTGRWLVSEYVFNPDGTFAGIVQQKRYVERESDTHLRVIQDCEPSPELASHPMAEFKGHWEFDLHINGNQREYHGLDVVGTGIPYGKNTMLGQGIWTRFGYNFTSFGVLPTPERQLTGGAFFNVNQMMTRIVGVASPERQDAIEAYPTLAQDISIYDCYKQWHGKSAHYTDDGTLISENNITISFDEYGNSQSEALSIESQDEFGTIKGIVTMGDKSVEVYGKRKKYGCLVDEILYSADGLVIQSQSIIDTIQNTFVIIRKWKKINQTTQVEILTLNPKQ